MKAGAAALLLAALIVFAATYLDSGGANGWVGFVRAGAEAAMVGGLADWFAVTALFRHPLGLPIPHTALIPRRKDAIGESLGGFVQDNFLSPEIVVSRLREADVVARLAIWLADRGHAERVSAELATFIRAGLAEARRDEVSSVLAHAAIDRLAAASYAPLAGRLLQQVVEDGNHRPVVDLMVRSTREWLTDNDEMVIRNIKRLAPGYVPRFVKDPVVEHVFERSVILALEVERDPDHELRHSLDTLVLAYARDLQADESVSAPFERFVRTIVRHPGTARSVQGLLDGVIEALGELTHEPDGPVRTAVTDRLVAVAGRLRDDEEFADRVEQIVERFAAYVVRTYAGEFSHLVSDTVARWDPTETTERIELQVGRDLQFIRINGTVVGALAGLLIHAVTVVGVG